MHRSQERYKFKEEWNVSTKTYYNLYDLSKVTGKKYVDEACEIAVRSKLVCCE